MRAWHTGSNCLRSPQPYQFRMWWRHECGDVTSAVTSRVLAYQVTWTTFSPGGPPSHKTYTCQKKFRHRYSYQKHRGCKSSALPLNHSNLCYINTKTDSSPHILARCLSGLVYLRNFSALRQFPIHVSLKIIQRNNEKVITFYVSNWRTPLFSGFHFRRQLPQRGQRWQRS